MSRRHRANPRPAFAGRRGLTLIEFLLAISITSLVALASAAILLAVSQSTRADRLTRECIVRSQAINVRLSSYVTPSLCVLAAQDDSLVLWLDDSRLSDTVHATEVRWIDLDEETQTLRLRLVAFPDDWSQIDRDTYDVELPANSDWWAVLASFEALGHTETVRISDAVQSLEVRHDASTPQGKRLVTFAIRFTDEAGGQEAVAAASIREHKEPTA